MDYVKKKRFDVIRIKSLISVHYFEYYKDFKFAGEYHDFWEFLYVDKGEVNVQADFVWHSLKQGEIIFHKPNEFHNVQANGVTAPNLVVVGFDSSSKAMSWFSNKIFKVSSTTRKFIADIVFEAKQAFSSSQNDPYLKYLTRRKRAIFGSEQMVYLNLEQLLISLRREQPPVSAKLPGIMKQSAETNLFEKILHFFETNLDSQITLTDLCKIFPVGQSTIKKLFYEKAQCGVIEYHRKLRINEAKRLIREKNMNFTVISEELDFSSLHYFSRCFKKITGMSPSEYARSLKSITEI